MSGTVVTNNITSESGDLNISSASTNINFPAVSIIQYASTTLTTSHTSVQDSAVSTTSNTPLTFLTIATVVNSNVYLDLRASIINSTHTEVASYKCSYNLKNNAGSITILGPFFEEKTWETDLIVSFSLSISAPNVIVNAVGPTGINATWQIHSIQTIVAI